MKIIWLYILCDILFVTCQTYNSYGYPYCVNETATSYYGGIDYGATLTKCVNNMQGSSFPASYFIANETSGSYGPTNICVSLTINNFLSVDDVQAQISMDFWLKIGWEEPRIYLPPEFWSTLNPNVLKEGLEISPYVRNSATPLNIWLPDIYFYEMISGDILAELIRLFPNGQIFWSRHFLVTMTESQMNLLNYPLDTQNFTMTFQSFAYDQSFVKLSFCNNSKNVPQAISLNLDKALNTYFVNLNQLWTYDTSSAYLAPSPSPIFFDTKRVYSNSYMSIQFTRQSYGVVFRLALPITIFLVIVGFTFWADIDKRIDVTVTMLLVISALYLVIGQIIPFVGYFTLMDLYITTSFVILTFTVAIHFVILQLDKKVGKYPMNGFIRDLIVAFFRLAWIPGACYLFSVWFGLNQIYITLTTSIVLSVTVTQAFLKRKQLTKSLKVSILRLREKDEVIKHGKAYGGTSGGEMDEEDDDKKGARKLNTMERFCLGMTQNWFQDKVDNEKLMKLVEGRKDVDIEMQVLHLPAMEFIETLTPPPSARDSLHREDDVVASSGSAFREKDKEDPDRDPDRDPYDLNREHGGQRRLHVRMDSPRRVSESTNGVSVASLTASINRKTSTNHPSSPVVNSPRHTANPLMQSMQKRHYQCDSDDEEK